MGASGNGSSGLPPFLTKTYEMVDDPGTNPIVSWSAGNNSFVVWNSLEFARVLLPMYFKHNNFSSFVRQLNTYGFRKIDPDRWEFANEGFRRGHKHLLKSIHRRKPIHSHSQQQAESNSSGLCVEELEEAVERLKQEKHVLLMELMRLRERQQGTELHLQSLVQRLEAMEQRQQQMVAFLAKAMKNPGFLVPIFQNNEFDGHLVSANKKRRLPEQSNNLKTLEDQFGNAQIVKWRPVAHDAAKTALMQDFKTDPSDKADSSSGTSENDSFYDLGNGASSEAMDDGSPLSRSSGVTLTEMHGNSGITDISLALSDIHTTSALSDVNSSPVLPEMPETSRLPNMQASSGLEEPISCDTPCLELLPSRLEFSKMDTVKMVIPQGNAECADSMGSKTGSIDTLAMEARLSNDAAKVSLGRVADVGMSVGCTRTGVNDVFWQQFLTERPGSTDTEEADSRI